MSDLKINPGAPVLNYPALGVRKLHQMGFTGKGIGIAVIDSGIHPHPDFKGRIVAFKDFTNGGNSVYDDAGHGTHVAGIAAGSGASSSGKVQGVAPRANLIGLKVMNQWGHANSGTENTIAAINWCIKNKEKYNIKVINISLTLSNNPKLSRIIKEAVKDGIVIVKSAGNDGPEKGTINYPGILPDVITVGNLDQNETEDPKDDKIDDFSSRGPAPGGLKKPDLSAPGVKIYAPYVPDGNIDNETEWDADKDGKIDYIALSGTSFAAPFVSGVAALMLQTNPELTPDEVKYILMDTADSLPGVDYTAQGKGVINPEKAVKRAQLFFRFKKHLKPF